MGKGMKNRKTYKREYYYKNKENITKYRLKNKEFRVGAEALCVGEKSLLLRRLPSPLCSVTPQRRNEMEKCHQL
jgi:hypothetical protein